MISSALLTAVREVAGATEVLAGHGLHEGFSSFWSHRAVRVRHSGDAPDDESVTAMVSDDQLRDGFHAERPRLQRIAARILGDAHAAEDVVQQAWLRLHATDEPIDNLPGWLTTVTSRLCLDRLRARTPVPTESIEVEATAPDPADDVVLADTVGIALQVVLDRFTPAERVAFVLHDSFGVDFDLIASMLDTTPVAARKLASRARAKVRPAAPEDALADWEIVDAFMAAAREGDFARLLELLAPDVVVSADAAASALGTPTRLRAATRWQLLQRRCRGCLPGLRRGSPGRGAGSTAARSRSPSISPSRAAVSKPTVPCRRRRAGRRATSRGWDHAAMTRARRSEVRRRRRSGWFR